jgi:hypothetical protein
MNETRISPSISPLALALVVALSGAASAQQAAAARSSAATAKQGAPKPQAATTAQRPIVTAQATPGGGQPVLLGQYGDWGAYLGNSSGRKVCFALAKPASSQTEPPNRPRDPIFMFVSSRPAEQVTNEVSIIIGYPFRPGAEAVIEIGTAKFMMYTQGDGAWIKNAAEEARMVDAMRRGSDLVVRGTSSRGTKTTDTFSLKGISQALDRAAQECK